MKSQDLTPLWKRFKQSGDKVARDDLLLAYAPLVKFVAGRMAAGLPSHLDEADLVGYGLLGLIAAMDRFDLERGIKFETYAVTRIKGAILDELRSLDWAPRSLRALARQIEEKHALLENKLQRPPNDEEMAAALEISVEKFNKTLGDIANTSLVALDELWVLSGTGSSAVALIDVLEDPKAKSPEVQFSISELKERLAQAIGRLPEREKIVVALYYYEGLTLHEIGDVLGVSESRASQLHTKAILRLRSRLGTSLDAATVADISER